MKIIGSVKEDLVTEKRISITPETVKRLIKLNFSIFLEKNYGEHLGITDQEYKNQGVNLFRLSLSKRGSNWPIRIDLSFIE